MTYISSYKNRIQDRGETDDQPDQRRNSEARLAMKGAWKFARRGQTIFGGSVRAYIAEALRIAWAELLADPVFQEFRKIIAEIRARKASGTWRHPAAIAQCPAYAGAWIGR